MFLLMVSILEGKQTHSVTEHRLTKWNKYLLVSDRSASFHFSQGRFYTTYGSGFNRNVGFCFTFNDSKCLHAVNEVYLT